MLYRLYNSGHRPYSLYGSNGRADLGQNTELLNRCWSPSHSTPFLYDWVNMYYKALSDQMRFEMCYINVHLPYTMYALHFRWLCKLLAMECIVKLNLYNTYISSSPEGADGQQGCNISQQMLWTMNTIASYLSKLSYFLNYSVVIQLRQLHTTNVFNIIHVVEMFLFLLHSLSPNGVVYLHCEMDF